MKANASSSSVTNPLFEVDLQGSGRFPPLPTAFLAGKDHDLLEPLHFLTPGELPASPNPTDRTALAEALGEVNAGYGVERAAELAAKFADPSTAVVVTGQQPGIFGGPLLTLSKMLAAVRYADALEAEGRPAVPVFWVATEDHDWDEAAQTTLIGSGAPEIWTLGEDTEPLKPLGERALGPEVEKIEARLRELFNSDQAVVRLDTLTAVHRPESGFGEAFCRTMAAVLGSRSPLFLDSRLPALKKAQVPHLRRLVEKRFELDEAYAAADRELEKRGYPLQVTPQPGVSPLFLVHGGERRRIEWRGEDRFGLRGLEDFEAPVDDLLEILEREPERVSPGVLARPGIQDAVLGSALQLMGPSELSYMTQARAAYPILGVDHTFTTLRPQIMAVDPKTADYLEELELSLPELFEQGAEGIVASRFGRDFITPIRDRISATLDELEKPVLDIDKSLEKPLQKTKDHIHRGLDNFLGRVEAAVARNHETWTRRVEQIKHNLVPEGDLQERSLSTGLLWIRYGDELVDAVYDCMRLESRRLDVARWGREKANK